MQLINALSNFHGWGCVGKGNSLTFRFLKQTSKFAGMDKIRSFYQRPIFRGKIMFVRANVDRFPRLTPRWKHILETYKFLSLDF